MIIPPQGDRVRRRRQLMKRWTTTLSTTINSERRGGEDHQWSHPSHRLPRSVSLLTKERRSVRSWTQLPLELTFDALLRPHTSYVDDGLDFLEEEQEKACRTQRQEK